jgi:hypothetical protein
MAADMLGAGFDVENVRYVVRATFVQVVTAILQKAHREGRSVGEIARAFACQNHCEMNKPATTSSNKIGQVSQVLKNQGLSGVWRRLAWRAHYRWPGLKGEILRAAADRYTELTLGTTLIRAIASHAGGLS